MSELDSSIDQNNIVAQPIPNLGVSEDDDFVRKERVSELIKEAKSKGYAKGRKDSEKDNAGYSVDVEDIKRVAKEEACKVMETLREAENNQRLENEAEKVIKKFADRLQETAKSKKYSDFEESISDLQVANMTQLIQESLKHDNTSDIIYELAKQPEKLQLLENLARAQPQLAARKIAEFSASLKKKEGAKSQTVHEPLSQESSTVVSKNMSELSMQELMRLRLKARR